MFLTYLLLVVGLLISPVGAQADAPEPEETATADTGTATEADSDAEAATEAAQPVTREVRWQVRSGAEAVPGTAWTLTDSDGTVRSVTDNAGATGTRLADEDSADGAFAVAELPVGTYTVVATEVGDGFVTPAPTRFEVTEGTGPQGLDAIALTAEQSAVEATEESASKESESEESDVDAQAESADPTTEAEDVSDEPTRDSTEADAQSAEPTTPDTAKSEAKTSSMAPNAVPNPQPAAQPPLPTKCGLDIAIVLDLSNSLTNADVANSKTAAKGFVNALEGTPSSVGLYTFATFANPSNSLGITSVATAAGATTVRNKIDAVARVASNEGGTNWDKGFAQVPTGTYDLIVFVTDGNPTAYGTPGTGGNNDFGTGTQDIDINEGIKSANVHKNAGTFVIGLGVGEVTAQNIRYISGNRQNTDYYLISDYDALSAALKEIALKNCEGTLTVVKQVRGLDGTLRPGQDWTFTSTTDTVSPASGQTDENGAINYDVAFSGGASTRPVTITETQQDLHRLEQQSGQNAVCTNRSTGQAVTVANSGGLGFTVDVPRDGAISCTVINAQYELYEDLTLTQTATPSFDRDYDWSLVKDVDRTEAQVAAGTEASFDYSVVVTPSEAQDSNFRLAGMVTVHNPNPSPVRGVTVADVVEGAECTVTDGTDLTVPAGDEIEVAYTCTFASADAATTAQDTATATWDAASHNGSTGTVTASQAIDFGAVTPEVTDAEVTVTDNLLGMEETLRAVDGEQRFDYTLEFAGEAGTCTDYENTATLASDDGEELSDSETVSVCVGVDLEVSKNVVSSFDRAYSFEVEKSVDETSKDVDPETGAASFDYTVTVTDGPFADANWAMSGEITVVNPNDWQDVTATVTDQVDVGGGAECVVDGGDEVLVPAGESVELNYECTFTSEPDYDGTNTATVTWDAAEFATPGGEATGTAEVSSEGWSQTPINETVTILDDQTDPTAEPAELGEVTWTEEGNQTEFTYALSLDGKRGACLPFDNTATLVGDHDVELGSDSETVSVCWPQVDLTVTDLFAPQFDRDYDWSMVKDVDRTEAEVAAGAGASFDYSVVVTPTEAQDSNFRYRGVATVQNPNDAQITGVDVTVEAPGADCAVTRDVPSTIDANGRILVGYTCEFPDATAVTAGIHTTTVTWDAEAHYGTTGSTVAETDFDFADARVSTTDDVVTVTDDLAELSERLRAVDGEQRFDYSLDLGSEAGSCTEHTNTATLSSDDKQELSDSETVTVCAPQWDLAKTSDPVSGSEVQVGDTITYTLTASNRGSAVVAEAIVNDDLSKVLDNAALVDGSITASAGEYDFDEDSDTLTWTVTELAGVETISYQVTVDEDAWDVTLRNSATGVGAECEPTSAEGMSTLAATDDEDPCPPVSTEHHTPKQPEPEPTPSTPVPGTPVESGDPTPSAPAGGSDSSDPATGAGTGSGSTVTGTGSDTTATGGTLANTGAAAGLLGLLTIGALAVLAGGWLVVRRRFGQEGA